MFKKKILVFLLIAFFVLSLSGCSNSSVNLSDNIIEKRENLFTASNDLYTVNFSTGLREKDYNFDGAINEMVPFGVLSISRNDNLPLANDNYSYTVTINEQNYSGFLTKSATDNSYLTDLEVNTVGDEKINVQISFTGHTFNKDLENVSASFQVDCNSAIKVAQKELKKELENVTADKNVKIEAVMKIMKDFSSPELKNYYWYVGVVSTNGDTMGILIDANNGNIIAKKA